MEKTHEGKETEKKKLFFEKNFNFQILKKSYLALRFFDFYEQFMIGALIGKSTQIEKSRSKGEEFFRWEK